jgi:integrase
VAAVDKALVLRVVQPIWQSKNQTASRVRRRIENVLDYAKVNGWREGENPAAWTGHLEHALPAPSKVAKVRHHAALAYEEIPGFMMQLRQRHGVAARALEFLILTVARSGEIIGAKWNEIDFSDKLWTVPPERMKAEKEHIVPLSDAAVKLLKSLPRESDFLFPGNSKGSAIGDSAMDRVLKRMKRLDTTVHGFRSSYRDWAGDQTAYDTQTIEFALAHGITDKTEASYRRRTAIQKRAKLMEAWAGYCGSPQRSGAASGNVVVGIRRQQ